MIHSHFCLLSKHTNFASQQFWFSFFLNHRATTIVFYFIGISFLFILLSSELVNQTANAPHYLIGQRSFLCYVVIVVIDGYVSIICYFIYYLFGFLFIPLLLHVNWLYSKPIDCLFWTKQRDCLFSIEAHVICYLKWTVFLR